MEAYGVAYTNVLPQVSCATHVVHFSRPSHSDRVISMSLFREVEGKRRRMRRAIIITNY